MARVPEPPAESRTIELLARIRDGEEEAWEELYRLYHDELLFAIRMKLGSRLRAALQSEDVLQSVALEAFRALPRFEHRGPGSLRAFLHRLVIHKICDRADTFGAKKRSGAVPLTDSLEARLPAGSTPTYHDADRFLALERALARLPEEMRQVVVLRRVEGYSSKEVAEQLGKTDGAVRKIYSRAIARLTLWMGEA